ncbi:MAG: hypothetical protein OXN16_12495 [Gammaproteobacteria bacterium]|nr:hypothetical protein [Gammaproteobacteria bacterium]
MSLPLMRHAHRDTIVVRGDADRPVHARQWYEFPLGGGGATETWCYTDRLSYAAGDEVAVHGISTADRVDIGIVRCGKACAGIDTLAGVPARWEKTPADASVNGCRWPVLAGFTVDPRWLSGVYLLTVRPSGQPDDRQCARHLFVVRPREPDPGRLLLITADSTWHAYNDWGGSNHYEGIVDPLGDRFSPRLSRLRPFARGFVALPEDAPRTLPHRPPAIGAPVSYDHMDWAWRNGYSKKYASAGWASYERHFLQWAERRGYGVDVATQSDLHYRPEVLSGYRCAVIVGHDEYWSWEMRDTVEDFVVCGGCVARFAGNFFWQVRLKDDGQTQICHKYRVREDDPVRNGPSPHLATGQWESPEVDRPGHGTFGLDGSRGVYAGWGGLAPRGPGGFTVFRPEHWALAGSGLGYGDVLGGQSRIFGYEVDGLDYRFEDGLPYPVPAATLPGDLEILAMGFARLREDGFGAPPEKLFVGDADARFVAGHVHGSPDPGTMARVDRGSGMIVRFSRDRGEVFNAGTTEWVAGLMRQDRSVEQVTRNVLDRFLAR